MQEQLRHDIAVLQKQLATQVSSLDHESRARAHLQEQHERQLRQFKLEVKRKLVVSLNKTFVSFYNPALHCSAPLFVPDLSISHVAEQAVDQWASIGINAKTYHACHEPVKCHAYEVGFVCCAHIAALLCCGRLCSTDGDEACNT